MAAIYDLSDRKKKIEGIGYSKMIEWLYDLSNNNRAWNLELWKLRKSDLKRVNSIYEHLQKSSHPQLNLLTNYLESINSLTKTIDRNLDEIDNYRKDIINLEDGVVNLSLNNMKVTKLKAKLFIKES